MQEIYCREIWRNTVSTDMVVVVLGILIKPALSKAKSSSLLKGLFSILKTEQRISITIFLVERKKERNVN
jgi:hypothetical protein